MTRPGDPRGDPRGDRCPACGDRGADRWGEVDGWTLRRCRSCATVATDRLPGPDVLEARYGGYWPAGPPELPASVERSLGRVVGRMERYRRTGWWLDVGFGRGELLHLAERAGWRVAGTELADGSLAYGRERGWRVAPSFDALGLAPGSCDVVSLVEVVEHLPEPAGIVARALELLRPGGCLRVTTPNVTGLAGRVLGPAWSVVAPPEHLVLFSPPGLREMLSRLGCRVERLRTEGLNPVELRTRFVPGTGGDPGAAGADRDGPGRESRRVASGVALNETFSATPARRRVKRMLNAILSATGTGDGIKVDAVRRHGRLAPRARRTEIAPGFPPTLDDPS